MKNEKNDFLKNIFQNALIMVKKHENTAIWTKIRSKIENNLQKIKILLKIIFKYAMMASR